MDSEIYHAFLMKFSAFESPLQVYCHRNNSSQYYSRSGCAVRDPREGRMVFPVVQLSLKSGAAAPPPPHHYPRSSKYHNYARFQRLELIDFPRRTIIPKLDFPRCIKIPTNDLPKWIKIPRFI